MKQYWYTPVQVPWHSVDRLIEMERWLEENIHRHDWDYEGHYGYRTYFFAQAKDATLFALRWAS